MRGRSNVSKTTDVRISHACVFTPDWVTRQRSLPQDRGLAQEALAAEMEDQDLTLVGASAIEDKLQAILQVCIATAW